jgi:hypothetical protein
MMVCVVISILQFAARLLPNWDGGYLPWVALLVSIEAMYSQRKLHGIAKINTSFLIYRFVEWIVILIVLKIFILIWQSINRGQDIYSVFLPNVTDNFFDPEYSFTIIIAFIIWGISGWFAEDLIELEGDESILRAQSDGYVVNRSAIRQGLLNRVLIIGAAMIFLTGIVNLDLRRLWGERPIPETNVYNVIIYFVLGLILSSMTQFSALRASWAWDRIPVDKDLAKRWFVNITLLFVVVAVIAALLPTNYSLDFLTTLGMLINGILVLLFSIISLLFLPFYIIGGFLISLFSFGEDSGQVPTIQPPFLAPSNLAEGAPFPWLDFLKSLLYWSLFIGVIVYAFYVYAKQNRELVDKLLKIPEVGWLINSWKRLFGYISTGAKKIPVDFQSRWKKIRDSSENLLFIKPWKYINIRKLSPRQQVQFYYLALVRRGENVGIPRKKSQTPYEYAESINEYNTEIEGAVDSLTSSFVDARYSEHDISEEHAGMVKKQWDQIRQAFLHWQGRKGRING